MMESELRRGLVLVHNDPLEFLQRPLFLVLMAVGAIAFATAVRLVDQRARMQNERP
jgi:TctA family transporter